MDEVIICILIILMGLLSVAASIFNWDWYFNSRRIRLVVKMLGRQDARTLYMVFGLFQIGLALFFLFDN